MWTQINKSMFHIFHSDAMCISSIYTLIPRTEKIKLQGQHFSEDEKKRMVFLGNKCILSTKKWKT